MLEFRPIEIIKFCPRCGSSDFPSVSERSFKCIKCGFHYFINSAAAVAAIILNEKGEMLFTHRAVEPDFGKLDLPGGFVDPMETAEVALARELNEELGIEIESATYFSSAPNEYVFSDFMVYTLDLAFQVNPVSITGMKAGDDISDFEFISPEKVDFSELPSRSMQFFVKEWIRKNG